MMKTPVYLDHHSTTPIDPRVKEVMMPYFDSEFGNAASRNHVFGRHAFEATEKARAQVAKLIGAEPEEIVFTSGATESNNLALKGIAEMYREKGNHFVTCVTEHRSVLDTFRRLESSGFSVTYLGVAPDGRILIDQLRNALKSETLLVSIMMANNEIGVLQPLSQIASIAGPSGILIHTDATQAVGKGPVDVNALKVDLMSFSSHKMYGPKGVGALYIRSKNPRVRLEPLLDGGGHEKGLRSGTLNVPAVVGFGKACELASGEMSLEAKRLETLRDRLKDGLLNQLDHIYINGSLEHRLPHNLNVSFAFVESESLMKSIPDIAVSSGAACTTANIEPSHVLRALGLREELVHMSIRFGLGRFNTTEEVDYVVGRFVEEVKRLRGLSPLYEMAKKGDVASTVQWALD